MNRMSCLTCVALLTISTAAMAQTTQPAEAFEKLANDLLDENQRLQKEVMRLKIENQELQRMVAALKGEPKPHINPTVPLIPNTVPEGWLEQRFNNGIFYIVPLQKKPSMPEAPER